MSNDYFDSADYVEAVAFTLARASTVNAMMAAVEAGFDLLPARRKLTEDRVTYVVDTGAADAYVVTLTPVPLTYTAGMRLSVKITNANTGACTINVNGLGAVSIKRTTLENPAADDLPAGGIADLRHDGTYFQLMNRATGAGATGATGATGPQGPAGPTGAGTGDMLAANNLSDVASAATSRDNLGVEIGVDVQAYDATLAALAGWANGTSKIPYTTATDVVASLDFLDEDAMTSNSATAVPSQQSVKAYVDSSAGAPRSYLAGLGMSNNGSDAVNDIDVAVGMCRDSTNAATITLAAAITKKLDVAWAVGNNQGGLDTGAIANGTYHVWLIKRSDTAVVDVLFSTSASAPTMPASYDYKRRIGAILRAGATILAFSQLGDEFLLSSPVLDVDVNPDANVATRTLASCPTGIQVHAILNVIQIDDGTGSQVTTYYSPLDVTDMAASIAAAPLGSTAQNQSITGGTIRVRTNTSAQIRTRGSHTGVTALRIATLGWIDRRGRDD